MRNKRYGLNLNSIKHRVRSGQRVFWQTTSTGFRPGWDVKPITVYSYGANALVSNEGIILEPKFIFAHKREAVAHCKRIVRYNRVKDAGVQARMNTLFSGIREIFENSLKDFNYIEKFKAIKIINKNVYYMDEMTCTPPSEIAKKFPLLDVSDYNNKKNFLIINEGNS